MGFPVDSCALWSILLYSCEFYSTYIKRISWNFFIVFLKIHVYCGVFLCIPVNFVVLIEMHTLKSRIFMCIPVYSCKFEIFPKLYF